MFKKFFPVLLLFLFSLFLAIDRFTHRKSTHFSLSKISAVNSLFSHTDTPSLSSQEQKELTPILNQRFHYFGKSTHAYLFLSEDGKYVLKFLKQHALRPKSWLAYIPLAFNPYYQEQRLKLLEQEKLFTSYKMAFTHLKEETGLIYMHTSPTCTLNKKVHIFDKNEKAYTVNLDKTSFYIQKRAQLIYPRLSELMRAGNTCAAKELITSVFSLIDNLHKKGVCGNDLTFYKNFGIIDDKAVQLAISNIKISPLQSLNLNAITESFRTWLQRNYPELLSHFDEQEFHSLK